MSKLKHVIGAFIAIALFILLAVFAASKVLACENALMDSEGYCYYSTHIDMTKEIEVEADRKFKREAQKAHLMTHARKGQQTQIHDPGHKVVKRNK